MIVLTLLATLVLIRRQQTTLDPRLLMTLDAQEAVSVVALASKTDVVAAGSYYGTITLWRISDGMRLRQWQAHPQNVVALAFTFDGALLLSGGSDGQVIAWEVTTGQQRYALPGILVGPHDWYTGSDGRERSTQSGIHALAAHPQQALAVAGGWQGQLVMFQSDTGQLIHTWQGHALPNAPDRYETITTLTFSANGARLASGASQGSIIIWDVQHDRHVQLAPIPAVRVQTLCFTKADQQLVATFGSQAVAHWSTVDGSLLQAFPIETWDIPASALSSDGVYLVRSGPTYVGSFTSNLPILGRKPDFSIYVSNTQNGATLWTLAGHKGVVRALVINENHRVLASGGEDATVRLWRIDD